MISKRKIIGVFFLLASVTLILGGCGFKDIDKRFFVVAMGIDPGTRKDLIKVTLRLAIPSSKIESGEAKTELESLEAPTIAEAIRRIKSLVDKELDFGHCRVILFGKETLENGVRESTNWFLRRRDIQMVAYVGMAEPNATDVLQLKPQSERYPGNSLILSFGSEGTESSFILTEYLFDWTRRLAETGTDGFLPVVRVDKDKNSYQIDKVAFLDKQKLRLCLNATETQLFNISAKKFRKSIISVPIENVPIVLALSSVRTHIDYSKGEIPEITLRLRATGMLEESPSKFLNGNNRVIEQKIEKAFNDQVETLLYKIRDAGVDPYGFGLHYLSTYFGDHKMWERWKSAYPTIKFHVKSRIVIEETGLVE
ncbi:Ger(x)C family spore germination protein [Cohnella endophytica]|uniref:Ger(X)C family spore germination protein n=1 Tax=Cohnella endophytica TaxID=2419778 RepID=A0A494XUA0_9BACL|nr:Ger(x)C family spore germination protein [Cohnella endophytica]RKP54201.1 Ger(x)C family spore germination protein [Cohnella endophytica]